MALQSSRSLAFLVGALGTLGVAQGCVDDGVSMHVICSIPPEVDDMGCTWSPDGDTCVAEGVLNVASASNYRMTLRVESGLKPRARDVPPAGEPNGVQLLSAKVELRTTSGARIVGFGNDANGKPLPNPYEAVATGYLPPNGVNATSIVVIPHEYIAPLQVSLAKTPQIVAAIQLKGMTNGTLDVESSDFVWPIRLINTNPDPQVGECIPADVCPSLVGQDGFAEACTQ